MNASAIGDDAIRFGKVAEAARLCLQNSPYWGLHAVSCECDCGVLFLTGHLASFYYKQLAQEAVARVKGASMVINQIEVSQ